MRSYISTTNAAILDALKDEQSDLDARISLLSSDLEEDDERDLTNRVTRDMVRAQLTSMISYSAILGARIRKYELSAGY